MDTLEGSILMWIGIFIYSPLLAVWEFVGAALGSIIGNNMGYFVTNNVTVSKKNASILCIQITGIKLSKRAIFIIRC